MQEIENNSNKDLEKIDKDINFHRIIIFLIIIAVIFFYLIMKDIDVKDAAQHWGPVGDFFGGILNPIFALFAFYWLTYSVRLQINELTETRKELKKAASAQEESARHQKAIAELENENVITQKELLDLQKKTLLSQQISNQDQQQQIEIQNFESLFFELIKTKNEAINMIRMSEKFEGKEEYFDGMNVFIIKVKDLKNSELTWHGYYENFLIDLFSSYISICNQIMILILDNKKRMNNSRSYEDIFKATLSTVELEIIFYSGIYNSKLKKNVEETSLLEALSPNLGFKENNKKYLIKNAFFYKREAFGFNNEWLQYFDDFERCELIYSDCEKLLSDKYKFNRVFNIYRFDDDIKINDVNCLINLVNNGILEYEKKLKTYSEMDREKFELKNLKGEYNSFIDTLNDLKNIKVTNELYFVLKYNINDISLKKFSSNA
ncbi:putative phage abortive infection protein [Acinetobacter sp. H1(2024)]|uniref:putative phage abortive infection protein n=1 Tax=Acinetobacter sp. H1(2024) TaxID=3390190 RepID=UPI00397D3EB6